MRSGKFEPGVIGSRLADDPRNKRRRPRLIPITSIETLADGTPHLAHERMVRCDVLKAGSLVEPQPFFDGGPDQPLLRVTHRITQEGRTHEPALSDAAHRRIHL